jgi:hypothetical protein
MSYDYVVMKLKRPVADPSELGPETVAAFEDVSSVRQAIGAAVSGIEWVDSGGSLEADGGWMEFCVSEDQPILEGFMVRTSHGSDHGWEAAVIRKLCGTNQWVAFDPQEGAFIALSPE